MRPHSFGTASFINRRMPEIKRKKDINAPNALLTGAAKAAPHIATQNWPMAIMAGLEGLYSGAQKPKGELDIAQAFGSLPQIASARSEAAKKKTKKLVKKTEKADDYES